MNKNHYVIVKNPNGVWYYYIYRYGKRIYRTTGEKSKAKALEVVYERLQEDDLLNEGKHYRPKVFEEFSKPFWIYDTCPIVKDKIERGGHYSKVFCVHNKANLENYILPTFGKKFIIDITPDAISSWLRNLPIKHGMTPQTANKIFKVLRQMLDVAVLQNIIDSNPAKMVKLLIEKPNARGCFTSKQIQELFNSVWDNRFTEVACVLSATTGMRMGEILALSRKQIKDDYIEVNRSYADLEGIKSTKSGKGRIVPVLPEVKEALLDLPSVSSEFIFSVKKDSPITRKVILGGLKRQMEYCKIDYKANNLTFHSFRHFFNTRLVAENIDGEHIRAVVGHQSEQLTEHYLHLTSSDMDAIRKVQKAIIA